MDLAREDILALVEQTWETLFGESVESVEIPSSGGMEMRATVGISGEWNGRVVLDLGPESALQIACRLLEASPGELEPPAILDAAGEMANILAGNLKSMLPQPSKLGLPVVEAGDAIGNSPESCIPNPHTVSILWNEARISVRLVEDSGPATGGLP